MEGWPGWLRGIAFGAVLTACGMGVSSAGGGESVKLAVAGPMVGTSGAVGVQYRFGVTAALQALPDGLLLGRRVEVSAHDDNCNTEIARAVARTLAEASPAVVIGHSCSQATLAAAPVYAANGVLQITPASTSPRVTELGIPTLFRMIGRDDVQGEMAAERLTTRHPGAKVGVLHFPGTYSLVLARTAIAGLQRRGLDPALVIEAEAEQASYAAEIAALTEAGVEVLYLVGGGLDSGVFMRQARQMIAPFDVISADTLVSRIFTETAGEAAEGVAFTFPPSPTELASATSAVTAIQALDYDPGGYTLLAYAAFEVWAEGVRRAGSFDAAAVAQAIRSAPVQTALGAVSFDAKGDIVTPYPPFVWHVWKDGQRVRID